MEKEKKFTLIDRKTQIISLIILISLLSVIVLFFLGPFFVSGREVPIGIYISGFFIVFSLGMLFFGASMAYWKQLIVTGILAAVIGGILTYVLGYGAPPGFSEPIFFWDEGSILGIALLFVGIITIIVGLILRMRKKK